MRPSFAILTTVGFCLISAIPAVATTPGSPRPEVQANFKQLIETNECPGCDLAGVDLTRVSLAGANLEGANLAGAKLFLADLVGANLRNANLQGAGLGGADLADADLRGANLTGAVLEGAFTESARFDGQIVSRSPYEDEALAGVTEKVYVPAETTSKAVPYNQEVYIAPAAKEEASSVKQEEVKAQTDAPQEVAPAAPLVPAMDTEVAAKSLPAIAEIEVEPIADLKSTEPVHEADEASVLQDGPIAVMTGEEATQAKTLPMLADNTAVAPAPMAEERTDSTVVIDAGTAKKKPVVAVAPEGRKVRRGHQAVVEFADEPAEADAGSLEQPMQAAVEDETQPLENAAPEPVVEASPEPPVTPTVEPETEPAVGDAPAAPEPMAVPAGVAQQPKPAPTVEPAAAIPTQEPAAESDPEPAVTAAPMAKQAALDTGVAFSSETPDAHKERQTELVEQLLETKRCVECDLSGVDLSGRRLDEADLERVNLSGANLEGIRLKGANLKGANLERANLQRADLRQCDLYKANLDSADLTGADFKEALVDSASFSGALGVALEGAITEE